MVLALHFGRSCFLHIAGSYDDRYAVLQDALDALISLLYQHTSCGINMAMTIVESHISFGALLWTATAEDNSQQSSRLASVRLDPATPAKPNTIRTTRPPGLAVVDGRRTRDTWSMRLSRVRTAYSKLPLYACLAGVFRRICPPCI